MKIRAVWLIASLLATSAQAVVLYSNLPATGNNGPSSTNAANRFAKPFVPTLGGDARTMTILCQAITGLGSGNFTLELRADAAGVPGALLASGTGTAPLSAGLRTVTLSTPVPVVIGTRYWAVIYGDWPVWQNANTGTEAAPGNKESSNSGGTWTTRAAGVGPQYPSSLQVDGTPTNTAPSATGDTYATNEDTTLNVAAPGVLSNDTDPEGDALSAFLVTGPASGTLTLNANGSFSFVPAANTSGAVTFTYRARDAVLFTSTVTVTINVASVNDIPTFTPGASVSVNEDSGAQTLTWATNISAGPNEAAQTLTFGVVVGGSGSSLFSVQPAISSTGVLTFTPAANVSGTAVISVTLTDNGGTANGGVNTSTTQTLILTINPVNDAPTFNGSDQTVLEDSGARTVPGWATGITAGGGETGQALTFTATAANQALFSVQPSVDPATGTLTFTPAANAFGSTNLTVTLRDNGGTVSGGVDTTTKVFVITITGINDAPSFTKGADITVNEDAPAQNIAGWAQNISSGAGESQTLTFVVTAANPSLFSAQPAVSATGVLTFTAAPNATGSTNVTVTLGDDGGTANGGVNTSPSQTFVITLTPVNDAPAFVKGADVTVNEDAPAQTRNGWATALSTGAANESSQALTFTVTVPGASAGLFSVAPAISSSGVLTFTPAPNAFGSVTVTVTLSDNGGTANGGVDTSATQTFVITLTAINDVPSFTKGADVTINEDAPAQSINGWATALSAGPGEGTQTISFTVANVTAGTLTFSAAPSIAANGTLSFTTAPNSSGTASFSVRIVDNGGTTNGGVDTSAAQDFTITVNPVNDAPTFSAGADVSVTEDSMAYSAAWATAISSGPADEASQTLVFTVTASDPSLFSVQPSLSNTGLLTFTAAADAAGTATISVTLTDSGGTANGGVDSSASQTFTITLNGINDAPSFVKGLDVNVDEDSAAQTLTGWATAVSAGNPAESGQAVSFIVTPSDASLFQAGPSIAADGSLSFTPAADAFGTATVTVVLVDNGGTANGGVDSSASQTFTLTIRSINDAPRFLKGGDLTVQLNAPPYTNLAWASAVSPGPANESTQTLLFSTMTDNDALFAVRPAIAIDGTLTFTTAADVTGVAHVEVTLSDNGGMANGGLDTTAAQTFVISVLTEDGGMFVADAGADGGAIDVDGGTDAGTATGGGAGGGGGTGGGTATGGGSATGGSGGGDDAMDGGTGGGSGDATPGCGCNGTDANGLLALALAGLAMRSRRRSR